MVSFSLAGVEVLLVGTALDASSVDHFDGLVWIVMNREGDTACVVVTRDGRYRMNQMWVCGGLRLGVKVLGYCRRKKRDENAIMEVLVYHGNNEEESNAIESLRGMVTLRTLSHQPQPHSFRG